MASLENMQVATFVHSSLLRHLLKTTETKGRGSQAGRPQVRTLVGRPCKRLGLLDDTGQSTISVGVSTSWRGDI